MSAGDEFHGGPADNDEDRYRAAGLRSGRIAVPRVMDRVRESVALRVEATSVRQVARAVGVSPRVIEGFVAGGMPQQSARQKLEAWWDRSGLRPRLDITPRGARGVLDHLLEGVAEDRREAACRRLVMELVGAYEGSGYVPPWLAAMQENEAPR